MSMNKTTKGGLAAGAAAVLLLGGAGTLAFWTDEATLDGGSITAGDLSLTDAECEDWTYAEDAAGDGEVVDLFVPGDEITNTCTFVISATGDNLAAELDISDVDYDDQDTSLTLTPTATYTVGSRTLDAGANEITSAEDGLTVTAVIDVDIPFGSSDRSALDGTVNENDTQGLTAALDDIDITLTQTDPNL